MIIKAGNMTFSELNGKIRESGDDSVLIEECCGQRYIAAGLKNVSVTINGTPGNALGAYADGAVITVNGNAQDATGDTMNDGEIVIYGSSGDATGYAMRGGRIFVQKNAGYRAGIHMKAYKDKQPKLVIGGSAGCFLGEYQAGGTIIVLGLGCEKGKAPVGSFCGTGMHGGKMFIRSAAAPTGLPEQVSCRVASDGDKAEIKELVDEYCH
ncbi:MAG: glutamate synthase, partial [Acutalibacteraceae bacterium]